MKGRARRVWIPSKLAVPTVGSHFPAGTDGPAGHDLLLRIPGDGELPAWHSRPKLSRATLQTARKTKPGYPQPKWSVATPAQKLATQLMPGHGDPAPCWWHGTGTGRHHLRHLPGSALRRRSLPDPCLSPGGSVAPCLLRPHTVASPAPCGAALERVCPWRGGSRLPLSHRREKKTPSEAARWCSEGIENTSPCQRARGGTGFSSTPGQALIAAASWSVAVAVPVGQRGCRSTLVVWSGRREGPHHSSATRAKTSPNHPLPSPRQGSDPPQSPTGCAWAPAASAGTGPLCPCRPPGHCHHGQPLAPTVQKSPKSSRFLCLQTKRLSQVTRTPSLGPQGAAGLRPERCPRSSRRVPAEKHRRVPQVGAEPWASARWEQPGCVSPPRPRAKSTHEGCRRRLQAAARARRVLSEQGVAARQRPAASPSPRGETGDGFGEGSPMQEHALSAPFTARPAAPQRAGMGQGWVGAGAGSVLASHGRSGLGPCTCSFQDPPGVKGSHERAKKIRIKRAQRPNPPCRSWVEVAAGAWHRPAGRRVPGTGPGSAPGSGEGFGLLVCAPHGTFLPLPRSPGTC